MTPPVDSVDAAAGWRVVDLEPWFDNDGISCAERPGDGGFNIWGNSFPAEELPASGSLVTIGGAPFRFPDKADGRRNNLRCRGQRLDLPPGRWDWLYLLAAAERRSEDEVWLRYADGTAARQWLRVSDFWPETGSRFGEPLAIRCRRLHYPGHVQDRMGPSIWRPRVGVPRRADLAAVELPDNPAIHLFALTLAADREAPP